MLVSLLGKKSRSSGGSSVANRAETPPAGTKGPSGKSSLLRYLAGRHSSYRSLSGWFTELTGEYDSH